MLRGPFPAPIRAPMPAPEPDLDVIIPLLWPETWRDGNRPEWLARRNAAAVALCWLCGVGALELNRLRRGDWMPEGEDVVRVFLPPKEGNERLAGVRNRLQPVPEAARLVINFYLAAAPCRRRPEAPLIPGPDGADLREETRKSAISGEVIARLTSNRVRSLAELSARYRRYLACGPGAAAGLPHRLGGRSARTQLYLRELPEVDDPRLARLVALRHPLGGKVDRSFAYDPATGLGRFR